MRIAQVSPLYESVPPKLYGGTERVVSFLTESLVDLGHEVTLFASGDSQTRARLIAGAPQALRLSQTCQDPIAHHVNMLEQVFRRVHEFDVVHFHIDYFGLPLARRYPIASVTTMHGRLDIPDLAPLFRTFADAPLVSISDAQRAPLSFANWQGTVYHGLPRELFTYCDRPGKYLAFLGRISPEKRVDRAVEIARRLDMPLKVAAKLDNKDRDYYEAEIKPLFSDPHVEYVGEISERDKSAFLGGAAALLFPIDWPEPFGLVMIESMACGTPVVAFRCGSVPEVMEDGVSGFIVDDLDQAVAATARAVELSRARCRRYFEERFLAARMARDYVAVYEQVIAAERWRDRGGHAARGLAAVTADDDRQPPARAVGSAAPAVEELGAEIV